VRRLRHGHTLPASRRERMRNDPSTLGLGDAFAGVGVSRPSLGEPQRIGQLGAGADAELRVGAAESRSSTPPRAPNTCMPFSAAMVHASASRRLLPIPAGPSTTRSDPHPAAAPSSARRTRRISASRSTIGAPVRLRLPCSRAVDACDDGRRRRRQTAACTTGSRAAERLCALRWAVQPGRWGAAST